MDMGQQQAVVVLVLDTDAGEGVVLQFYRVAFQVYLYVPLEQEEKKGPFYIAQFRAVIGIW